MKHQLLEVQPLQTHTFRVRLCIFIPKKVSLFFELDYT